LEYYCPLPAPPKPPNHRISLYIFRYPANEALHFTDSMRT
jgi:hypothetical protein